MQDVFGTALLDYQNGNYSEDIRTYSSLDEEDVLPLPYLFRNYEDMPPLEQKALELCKGKVLDIGCGAGSHSLYLQQQGFDVTALDSSAGAVKTCEIRGIEQVVHSNIYDFKERKFDTLLMLMNGIGIVGRLENLNRFFDHLKSLLQPGGQILLDSSDIIYMFEADEDGGHWVPNSGSYYGEVQFTMRYKNLKTKPFPWLFVDYSKLEHAALENGLSCKLVSLGKHYDYLMRLYYD